MTPEARRILQDAIVIDTLGGAVVHPTPYVPPGQTYEENMVGWGWNILHALPGVRALVLADSGPGAAAPSTRTCSTSR